MDVESGHLVPRAHELLGRTDRPGFTGELQQSVVESNSGVHDTLDGLWKDLASSRRRLDTAATALGLAVVAAGTVPLADVASQHVTADPRYRRMADDYRRLSDEQLICSAQIHVDVPDRDTAVRAMCLVSPWLPPLLALSASSPFWLGSDTGYASWRSMLWQRWPTAGPAGCHRDAADYDRSLAELIRSGVISDAGMIYHDIRPSAHQSTLELRICDACPRVETVALVAGLFRALVHQARERLERADGPLCDGRHDWLRAATWRAARSGLEGHLVDPVTRRAAPAPAVLTGMLARLRPALEATGDWESVHALLEEALAVGTAAHRLRRATRTDDLLAGVDLMAAETRGERRTPRPAARSRRPAARPDTLGAHPHADRSAAATPSS
ncbi:putative glutamate--cysteine ligase 2-2 [Streptomyces lucensis JCM 4490]|uniref:Putative glutamate--cysteine ligase 2 n=1 Tax=Streptomyces lucensis JCM 4490 TaxID=1306176 RepID=A0A918JA43_9ACTN|nr:putative glutamate--cysteine ligase 2-2 [Streptomyces lucensis JCM 4490]